MKSARTLPLTAILWAATASHATPIADWQIIEGYGLTDGYAYLGMTLAEAESRAPVQCYTPSSPTWVCTLRPDPDAPPIDVWFPERAEDAQAYRIEIRGGGWPIDWATTAGARARMPVKDVQALYPGSTRDIEDYGDIFSAAERDIHVYVRARGYDYLHSFSCNTDNGGPLLEKWTHVIFRPGHKPQHPKGDGHDFRPAGGRTPTGARSGADPVRDGCPRHFPDE
jgi:hypothetical protein